MFLKINNSEEFEEVIRNSNNLYVVVDFYAEWCKPCKKLMPIFEKLSSEIEDLDFIKIDVDMFDTIADTYDINELPTVLIFSTKNLEIEERFNIDSNGDIEKQLENLCKKYE